MAIAIGLRRLLQVRQLEEEQCRLGLEAALVELHKLESAFKSVQLYGLKALALLEGRVQGGTADRQAGRIEYEVAKVRLEALQRRMGEVEDEVSRLRWAYLAKQVERRQVDTLIEERVADEATERRRREQQTLDDAYRTRLYSERACPATKKFDATVLPSNDPRRDEKNLEEKHALQEGEMFNRNKPPEL